MPLGLVLLGLVSAEWVATQSMDALLLAIALFVSFCLVAPASYRVLTRRSSALGYVAYLIVCAAAVSSIGIAIPRAFGVSWTYIVDPSSIGILWVLFVVGGWGLARDIDLEEGWQAERDRAERLAESAERASLLALRAHLDPHFLFNTLNAIAEWCREDPAVAEAATLRLASMLRTMLEGIRSASWPLATEIALAQSLFDLYAIRDRARFRFRIDAPDPLPKLDVPPMLFLPLFENSITHGPSAGHDGEVVVRLSVEDDTLRIEIENPGRFRGRREGGEGIAMVERRLALAYSGRAHLSFDGDETHTLTLARVPSTPNAGLA